MIGGLPGEVRCPVLKAALDAGRMECHRRILVGLRVGASGQQRN
jgi:hypothetical protein